MIFKMLVQNLKAFICVCVSVLGQNCIFLRVESSCKSFFVLILISK